MKRKSTKLTLHRETLRALETSDLRGVGGAATNAGGCLSVTRACTDTGEGGYSNPTMQETCGFCSGQCATGGACTTSCG